MIGKRAGRLLGILALLTGLCGMPLFAKTIDLLHTVPLEISTYQKEQSIPEKFTSADQIISVLNQVPNLLVHMEVLRRGTSNLTIPEKDKLTQTLFKRYQTHNDEPSKFFDHGYAQLLYKDNKTGLFFLRKANDRIHNQFTNLAYAMAQADVDINFEKASPNTMTFRKLDVTYKLVDALDYDAKSHQPGFWPSFIRVLKQLSPFAAYANFTNTDFSDHYVPFANSLGTVEISRVESPATPPLGQGGNATKTTTPCDLKKTAVSPSELKRAFRTIPLKVGSTPTADLTAYFFMTEIPQQYRVAIFNAQKNLITEFLSPVAPYIVEDINGDGTDELVIRQYLKDPLMPVKVYRYTPSCGFQLDQTIVTLFQ